MWTFKSSKISEGLTSFRNPHVLNDDTITAHGRDLVLPIKMKNAALNKRKKNRTALITIGHGHTTQAYNSIR